MAIFSKLFCLSLAAAGFANAAEILSVANTQDVIPDSYIVVMKDQVSTATFEAHKNWLSETHRTNMTRRDLGFDGRVKSYNFGRMKGYSGKFNQDAVNEIANDPDVAFIEPDQIVRIQAEVTQPNAPWGLGRISSKARGNTNYYYDSSAGAGITAYDVDTGIDISHPDFEGRAIWGTNQVDSVDNDQNGHGTHVAGTIAGKTYGVAKKARLVAVKVLGADGSGSISGIIGGMEWSLNHARQNGGLGKSVMNMSLGGGRSASFNQAAASVVSAGMFLAVAAGNDGADAVNYSPASEPTVCTVGATGQNDAATSFSNYGSLVDIFAPGDGILSTYPGGGSRSLSGTSMASPHVCGLAAYLMAIEGISGSAVCDRIKELGNSVVSTRPGTTTLLAYNGSGH